MKAWGIVDSDRRGAEKVEQLRQSGIFVLNQFSVEALYYNPWIICRVADRMAAITGRDASVLSKTAIAGAITEAAKQRNHFIIDAAERLTRRTIFDSLPNRNEVRSNSSLKIEVDLSALKAAEEADFDGFIAAGDLDAILRRYPVRESGALNSIAKGVGLANRGDYEDVVRTMVQKDAEVMAHLLGFFSNLVAELSPSTTTTASTT